LIHTKLGQIIKISIIYPQDGLVKNNMEKLTFYALSSPEKLDRIGEYLFQKASRDISRKRNEWVLFNINKQIVHSNTFNCRFVMIAMEAMDQLLVACHAQTLNLFVESYLRIVQKLLESSEPSLQILATQSVSLIIYLFKHNSLYMWF